MAPASTTAATCSSAFATGNRIVSSDYGAQPPVVQELRMLSDAFIDPLFHATVEATEEAIVNALVAAETMTGRDRADCSRPATRPAWPALLDNYGLRSLT
ncbi:MAG: P1 family peptidase [Nocardioidaceae bacterium]